MLADKTENSDMLSRFAIALISIISSRKKGRERGPSQETGAVRENTKRGGEAFNERLF